MTLTRITKMLKELPNYGKTNINKVNKKKLFNLKLQDRKEILPYNKSQEITVLKNLAYKTKSLVLVQL